jgi:peptidoglycan/xylan/chitin deacetylase (PgdA/CDA1 family)
MNWLKKTKKIESPVCNKVHIGYRCLLECQPQILVSHLPVVVKQRNPMKVLSIILLLFLCLPSLGQQKQVCFTLDDLPVVHYGIADSTYQKELFHKIIRSLKSNKVPAIGFVNERKLYLNGKVLPWQVSLLKSWVANGLELGNHTFSHPDYNSVPFREFTADVIKGEPILKKILKEQNQSLKYFRHPFLHVGNTKVKADSLTAFLTKRNYVVAPVTIDNEDYLFALAYKRAKDKKDEALAGRIGQDYIAYMEKKLKYYEMLSNQLFGRNISHILLIHSSLLNADYLDALIGMYKANNYTFISMADALKDPAYQTEITAFGNWGVSWMDRWALSAGKKGEFLKEDPITPDYVKKMAK